MVSKEVPVQQDIGSETPAPPMKLNPITQAFIGPWKDLERPFIETYTLTSLKQLRITLGLGIILYSFFGGLDYIVAPEIMFKFWIVRFGIVAPSLLFVIVLSYFPVFKKIMQPVITLMILIAGGGIIYMTMIGPTPIIQTYFAGLMLVLMIGSSVVRARFLWAASAGFTLTLGYLAATVSMANLPLHVIFVNNYFCFAALFIGMLASYNLEFYARRDYYMSHLLKIEQEKVQTANQQLEQTVEKRTAMLVHANEELRNEVKIHQQLDEDKDQLEDQLRQAQKMEAIGTLAGGIAHDFNNILAGIMGHTELALIRLGRKENAEKYLSEVLNASTRAKDLVSQILSFSRQSDTELKPLQISTIIKEAMRLLRSTLPTTITIEKSISNEQCIVVGNATQIHQVLMNLCTNAAHAMEASGGTLSVALKPYDHVTGDRDKPLNHPTGLGPGRYVQLVISDTGHGIEPHFIARIFDPYFTTKEKEVGTGLGLAVVQGIIQKHGGIITVESKMGAGTTFDVFVPRVEGKIKQDFKKLQTIPDGTEKILLVEDDPDLAELSDKLLTTLGYRVTTLTDSKQALETFLDQPDAFDMIITDLIMPGLTGKMLAVEILKKRPRIPIIVCTGFGDMITDEELIESGIKGVLHKPITIYHLAQVIRQALEERD